MRQGAAFMSDGYDVYDAIATEHKLVHLGCWTHCRRYFNGVPPANLHELTI